MKFVSPETQMPLDRKNLREENLAELAELCATVARNPSADSEQSGKARALRVEWVRLHVHASPNSYRTEAESLKKRIIEFLEEIPSWMLAGF